MDIKKSQYKLIVIGGSAGSFSVVTALLKQIPKKFEIPIIICMHRLKHVRSGFEETLSLISKNMVIEPFHNDVLEKGKIYIAPANYHLIVEPEMTISLSTEELVNYTRPSIDVLFSSAAHSLKSSVIGIILSGANKDGARGLAQIHEMGGCTIVQDPTEAQVSTMPLTAIEQCKPTFVFKQNQIIDFIIDVSKTRR